MLLNCTQIADLLEDGVIENGSYDCINPASLDLRLGPIIQVETANFPSEGFMPQVVSLAKRESLHFTKVDLNNCPNKSFILRPGQFILAHTQEIFHLPNDISGEYKLKSSMARMGLEHLKAGWADAGFNNSVLTLEFRNLTTYHDIEIKLGDKIGQMVFFRHQPVPLEKSYATRGSYNGDKSAQPTKPEKV